MSCLSKTFQREQGMEGMCISLLYVKHSAHSRHLTCKCYSPLPISADLKSRDHVTMSSYMCLCVCVCIFAHMFCSPWSSVMYIIFSVNILLLFYIFLKLNLFIFNNDKKWKKQRKLEMNQISQVRYMAYQFMFPHALL